MKFVSPLFFALALISCINGRLRAQTYVTLTIESADDSVAFQYEGGYMLKSKEQSVFEKIEGNKAHKVLLAGGAGFLILRAKSGNGMITIDHSLAGAQKHSTHYLKHGEVLMTALIPLNAGVAWRTWSSGERLGPTDFELLVKTLRNP